jgi:hypothetical protein
MKHASIFKIVAALLLAGFFPSCTDFFDVDSSNVLKMEEHEINTEAKARYSMFGILQQLQSLGNNAVIFGELRSDLLDVTPNSPQELRDISRFEVKADNPYLDEKAYYALINNCNYMLNLLDTSTVVKSIKVLKKEMAATKAIRAWAYMQLCLNYGQVDYTEEDITDVSVEIKCKTMEMDELVEVLIEDLLPWKPVDNDPENLPYYDMIDGKNTIRFFIPVRFILGELYLWKKNYADAADMYYRTIRSYALTVPGSEINRWYNSQADAYGTVNWYRLFEDEYNWVSIIPYTDDFIGSSTALPDIFNTAYLVAPSSAAINNWNSQTYSFTATLTTSGDLRGYCGNYGSYTSETMDLSNSGEPVEYPVVLKYRMMNNYSIICRSSLLYLRYAEAMNRMGKHTLAFALLKYGLNRNIALPTYVSPNELTGEPYLEFGQTDNAIAGLFERNIGMHARGCGSVELNNSYMIDADADPMLWVEDQIVMEYALETAFEGNRFHDLMRISHHRDDPAFLAGKVAAKFPQGEQIYIYQKLTDKNNWFLPGQTNP